MNQFILDAGGAVLILVFAAIFLFITVVVEGLIMWIMKYNNAGKSFLDALIINLVSMAAGYLLTLVSGRPFDLDNLSDFLILYIITFVIEFIVLYFLNRKLPVQKTLLTAIVINIVSYLILYCFRFF